MNALELFVSYCLIQTFLTVEDYLNIKNGGYKPIKRTKKKEKKNERMLTYHHLTPQNV